MTTVKTSLLRRWENADKRNLKRRLLALLFLLALAFAVRGLTMRFIRDNLSDPGWFQSGSYALFDRQAQNILDGTSSIFWIDDPAKTEAAVYPPGYPIWLALIYRISGQRSAVAIQRVQWLLDSLSVLLIVAIGVTAYGWPVGITAGILAALSPLLALSGATPMADAPTSWIVLTGVWMLLLAFKRQRLGWAIGGGLAVGASCWLRPNAQLLVFSWVAAILVVLNLGWRRRLLLSGAVLIGMAIFVAPLLIRNAIAFRAFMPTGLGTGTNLWEGIGETERAAEFGAFVNDKDVLEQERKEMGVPADAPFSLYFPDGVKRDRARARKALTIIARNPVWHAGVMGRRMAGMLKYAGEPPPYMGSAGINVTSKKTLPAYLEGGPLALAVNVLGMIQSVLRWMLLPLIVAGLFLAFRREATITGLLLATVLYYLVVSSFLHSELRYALPMHALLHIWAAVALASLPTLISFVGASLRGRPSPRG
ncbi:MAG TPA: glycosyltransferase family 39 protein [Pyrinomonadaceae bacterium]|nr:glycosyltransferase family 39 protein [Pyrinomonadaceae bacterium]